MDSNRSFRARGDAATLRRTTPCALLAGVALLLVAANVWGIVLPRPRHVGPGNDCEFQSLESAIAGADSGDGLILEGVPEGSLFYSGKHLLIQDKSLNFSTGLCSPIIGVSQVDAVAAAHVVISGSGGADTSVFTITGTSSVSFTGIDIRDGHSSGQGGAINFYGTGTVTLTDVHLFANTAAYGGAIYINSNGGSATLRLNHDTLITGNTASGSGGGIRIVGNSRLFALAPYTFIALNKATSGTGGGIDIVGPARADIGSPGYSGIGVIYGNRAVRGGGISVSAGTGGSGQDAELRLFSTDPEQPVRISGNIATKTGGGIYLVPYVSSAVENDKSYADMCARNFRIDANSAQEGTAIYSDEQNNFAGARAGGVYLNTDNCGPESAVSLGAVACKLGIECNLIDANVAQDINAVPTAGSTLLMQDNADLSLSRAIMRDNVGGYLVRLIGTRDTSLQNVLMVENHVTDALIWQVQDSLGFNYPVVIGNSTIANNTIDGSWVIRNEVGMDLHDSIVDELNTATLKFTGNGNNLDVSYVLVDDDEGLPAGPTILINRPTFYDRPTLEDGHRRGDYRLRYSKAGGVVTQSLGLDYAPAVAGDDRDLRNAPFDQQLPVNDAYGPRDLGAFEMQPIADRIYADSLGDPMALAY